MTTSEGAAMTQPTNWSASEAENTAIETFAGYVRAMADLLHQTEAARYTDPSNGHITN